jgi:hypothetical protein
MCTGRTEPTLRDLLGCAPYGGGQRNLIWSVDRVWSGQKCELGHVSPPRAIFRLDPLLPCLVSEGTQKHALDNIRHSVGALGVRNGHCVHYGRADPSFALSCSSGFGDSPVSRAQDCVEEEFRSQNSEWGASVRLMEAGLPAEALEPLSADPVPPAASPIRLCPFPCFRREGTAWGLYNRPEYFGEDPE